MIQEQYSHTQYSHDHISPDELSGLGNRLIFLGWMKDLSGMREVYVSG